MYDKIEFSSYLHHGYIASSYNYETRIILPRKSLRQTPKPLKLAVPKDGSTNPDRPRGLVQYERFSWHIQGDVGSVVRLSFKVGQSSPRGSGSRSTKAMRLSLLS